MVKQKEKIKTVRRREPQRLFARESLSVRGRLPRPPVEAPGEVGDIFEPVREKHLAGLPGAASRLAVDDGLLPGVEFADPSRKRPERDQFRLQDVASGMFGRLTDVAKDEIRILDEQALQFQGSDL